ncbi:MAG: hypothetical protein KDA84_19945, partial [Planctomycetaceae bacterium]|nr:hypothetical protein [Planctomycetaceae bacterium]
NTETKTWRQELEEAFNPAVIGRVESFDDFAANCLAGEIPPTDERNFVRQVAEDWPAIGHWLQSRQFQVESQISEIQTQLQTTQTELQELQDGHRPLPAGLIQLEQELQKTGASVAVFCEAIEITNPVWQESIEAVLGPRRYDLLVPPDQFDTALSVFRSIDDPEMLAFGLVDTPRLMRTAMTPLQGSLASSVTSTNPLAKRYTEAVLGRVFSETGKTKFEADELDEHSSWLTEDGFLVGDFAVRRLPPVADHQSWQVGGGGLSGRREALQNHLQELREAYQTLSQLRERIQNTHEQFDRGRRGPELLAEDYDLPARLQEVRQEYLEAREEAAALKESDLGQLRKMVQDAEEAEHRVAKELKLAWGKQCVGEQSLTNAEITLTNAEKNLADIKAAYESSWPADSELAQQCEQFVAEKADEESWDDLIRGWKEQLQTLQKSFSQRHDDGVRLRTEYNNRFQFTGDCLCDSIQEYTDERA